MAFRAWGRIDDRWQHGMGLLAGIGQEEQGAVCNVITDEWQAIR